MVEEKKYTEEENLEIEQVETIEREQEATHLSVEEIYATGKDVKNAVKHLSDYEMDPEAIDLDNRVMDGKNIANNAVNVIENKWQEISWENNENSVNIEANEEVEMDIDEEEVVEV